MLLLGDSLSIIINNFCRNWWLVSSEKHLVKPQKKKKIGGPNLYYKGVMHYGLATPKKKNIFGRNNKIRPSAFRKCLFYRNIICFG